MRKSILFAAFALLAAALFTTSCKDMASDIEDPAFAEWCRANLDVNGNHRISPKEAALVEEIAAPSCGIASLKGIEMFPELKRLDCRDNKITELDLSGNPKIVTLDCQSNALTQLSFAEADIENLSCGGNAIKSLDVSSLKSLKALFCGGNAMETLVLGEKPVLKTLSCYDNRIKELDLAACPVLENLDCRGNELESLDLSTNPCLTRMLGVAYNNLTTIDLSANPDLKGVDCDKEVTVKGVASAVEITRY